MIEHVPAMTGKDRAATRAWRIGHHLRRKQGEYLAKVLEHAGGTEAPPRMAASTF
jgi:hypothetical protein